MDQHEMLWAYQAEDMKAEKMASDIRRNPLRQKMENDRTQYMDRQKQYKQLEEQVAVLADRKDAVRDALQRCEEQLAALKSRFEAAPPTDLESVRAMMHEVHKCQDTITNYEREMKRLVNEAASHNQRGNSLRTEAARLRSEFEQLKAQYDKEMPEKKAALDAQRALVQVKGTDLPAALLERYAQVKKHITPPLARLVNGQCSGCNTSLPSAVLHQVRNANEELVECAICGRLILRI